MAFYILDILALPRTRRILIRGVCAPDAPVAVEGKGGARRRGVEFAESVGETCVAWGTACGVLAQGDGSQVARDVGVGIAGPWGGAIGYGVTCAIRSAGDG